MDINLEREIIKEYNEGKIVESLAEEYGEMSCMAEIFNCKYPSRCEESGSYCNDCWINKIKKIVGE